MDNENKTNPIRGEFKRQPVIRVPLVENPSPEISWNWSTFGKTKAKAIVKFHEEIKKFAEE